jgi:protein-S-isoprenylcysteine O-methyltransferase Ste14
METTIPHQSSSGQSGRAVPAIDRGPGAPVPSTLIYSFGLAGGALLERAEPLSIVGGPIPAFQMIMGGGLAVLGLGLFIWSLRTFAAARTGIMPARSASCVVMSGPYRFSRNPMYVSFTAMYIGLALALDLPWAFVLLPGVLLALFGMVIRREERYMHGLFGGTYEEYCRQVPRWL